jgi:hypothetical protein
MSKREKKFFSTIGVGKHELQKEKKHALAKTWHKTVVPFRFGLS